MAENPDPKATTATNEPKTGEAASPAHPQKKSQILLNRLISQLKTGLKNILKGVFESLKKTPEKLRGKLKQVTETIESIHSEDAQTRKAAYTYIVSLTVFALLILYALGRMSYYKLQKVVANHAEHSPRPVPSILPRITLEPFRIPLKKPFRRFKARSIDPNVLFEITIECDSREPCEELKAHLPKVKDRIVSMVFGSEPDELMTSEGKKTLQARMVESLQSEVTSGRIREVLFLNFVIE